MAFTTDKFRELLDQMDDCETRSYSGRGMFGKTCLGVITTKPEDFVLDVIETAMDIYEDRSDLRDIIELLRDYRRDSMGTGYVLYWPKIPYEQED